MRGYAAAVCGRREFVQMGEGGRGETLKLHKMKRDRTLLRHSALLVEMSCNGRRWSIDLLFD